MQSLRVKLLAPFIAGTLALTLLLSWYTYSSARKAVEDAMLLISEAKTTNASSSMGLLFKSMETALQNMVVDSHVIALFQKQADDPSIRSKTGEWMEIITQGNEFYRDISIVDTNGICISSSNPGQVGASYADKPYVREALRGRFTLGDSSVGRVTKTFSTYGAGPVDVDGKIAGALVLTNDFPKIVDYDNHAAHDNLTIFTSLLTPDGLFVAHKDKELMGNKKELFPQLYQTLFKVGEKGAPVEFFLQGAIYVGYAKIEPVSKWLVLTSGVQSKVFASAYQMGLTVLGISLLFLCGIFFVVVRFANGILTSLLSLIAYAKRVSEGDFQEKLAITKRRDELGVLELSLQRLVDALQAMLLETQEASRMKGQFLANMSHEIRTPLNAIIGITHLSLRDANMPPKQREYLDKIQMAAKTLLGLINDVLDLSKVEAGMLELEEASFNLRETVENILTIHQEHAAAKRIFLHMEYEQGMPEHFIGDPLRIGQVLNNLINNAIKFTDKGEVSVACQHIGYAEATDSARRENRKLAVVRVDVNDTGIGIAPDKIPALFQMFTQADSSTSRQFGGTGLGLAISDKIVHLLNGSFTVASTIGRGTTFSFTMQLLVDTSVAASGKEELPVEEAFERLDLYGKHILVAEDNAVNQLILQEMIAPSGANIVIADNGRQAVDAARSTPFDLVLMDMQMPVMDGLEATRAIREFADMGTLPIIAVTANAMKEDKERGFASGMNDYLTKPIDPRHLLHILRVWLKREGTAGRS